MTKEKQIEELRDLIMIGSRLDINSATAFAETLYQRGWRKQNEWRGAAFAVSPFSR